MRATVLLFALSIFPAFPHPPGGEPSTPPSAQVSAPPQPAAPAKPKASPAGSRLYYFATPEAILSTEARTVPPKDQSRFDHLRSIFTEKGCSTDQLQIQPVDEKHHATPGNLICTWPGDSPNTVVVLAEYQREGKGEGAIENWSGAVLLPYLYLAIQARPRENTWVFVESAGKSGAAAWVRSLTPAQKQQIRAMIDLDSLGVSPVTRFYSPNPDSNYLSAPVVHLQMAMVLASLSDIRVPRPQSTSPLRWLPSDDTQPFRYSHIPCILIHSISVKDADLPGSSRDTADAIDTSAYYQNYRAIAVFLVALDSLAARLRTDDRIWHGEQGEFHLDLNDLPTLH
jgi:Peptidase family M28